MTEKIPMTKEGYEKLKAELKRLKEVERPQIIKAIEEARAHGDLSENAEYDAAKEKQLQLMYKIQELEDKLSRAEVIDTSQIKSDKVVFGAKVTLYDINNDKEVIYRIVGEDEANPSLGLISIKSPIARAVIGKKVGDEVEVTTPSGIKNFEIIKIEYGC